MKEIYIMAKATTHEMTSLRTLRKDRLTDDERMEALWNRQKPDRVPLWPLALGFDALNVGYTILDCYNTVEKSIDCQRWTCEEYGWQPFQFIIGAATSFGAEVYGGKIKWPTGEFAQAPTVARHPFETEEDVLNLKVPDNLEKCGTVPLMLQQTAYSMKFRGLKIAPLLAGPLDLGGPIIGVDRLCKWMILKPELVHKAFRVFTDLRIALAKLWADTFGAENLCPFIGGPMNSNQIISPKQFEEFILPYVKEQHAKFREMGYKHFWFHPCGEQNDNLPFWAQVDVGDPGIISVGHEIDLDTVAKYFPNDIVFGNLEPAIVQVGTPEQVYEASKELILKGKNYPGGYMFSLGCEAPPKAPSYNYWMMTKAVNDFGWYE